LQAGAGLRRPATGLFTYGPPDRNVDGIHLLPLPHEGRLPSLAGATGWLNSPPLTPADLRGRPALFQFGTFSCVNWLRTLPYVRAWPRAYGPAGLAVVLVHTPEFEFEHDRAAVEEALRGRGIDWPVAIDNDFGVWTAFANRFWPALYLADADGAIRHHHAGEGGYEQTERAIRRLLDADGPPTTPVVLRDDELSADWDAVASPETYVGYERTQSFASPEAAPPYSVPERLRLNEWALSGAWTVEASSAVLDEPGGSIAFRFLARDVNLVVGAASPVPFRVTLDGELPGAAHGIDVAPDGSGIVAAPRMVQLVRRPPTGERTFEVRFDGPGVRAYVFTFG